MISWLLEILWCLSRHSVHKLTSRFQAYALNTMPWRYWYSVQVPSVAGSRTIVKICNVCKSTPLKIKNQKDLYVIVTLLLQHGCNHAIYTVRCLVDSYLASGSTVNICASRWRLIQVSPQLSLTNPRDALHDD